MWLQKKNKICYNGWKNRIEDNMSFTKFQFKNYIEKALEELKFTTPTEVQDKLIPIVLTGRDLVG